MTVALAIIVAVLLVKYKPAYKVIIDGEEVGYVANKLQFEELVNREILNPDEENVAFVDIETMPDYSLLLVDSNEQTSENEIFEKLQAIAVTTYKMYAITMNDSNTTFVNSKEEAEEVIAKIKEEKDSEEIEIGMKEIYTENVEETKQILELASATKEAEEQLEIKIAEQKAIKEATFDGVYFSVKPVTGNITSRYGQVESIRDHAHTGLDIAAPAGTDIKAAADGEITFAGMQGGYGNLVIVTHENGIQTYYGHCSKIYASVGEKVEAGDVIAAVGSTGNSTGNHLHFEIRYNGIAVDPQNYLYN